MTANAPRSDLRAYSRNDGVTLSRLCSIYAREQVVRPDIRWADPTASIKALYKMGFQDCFDQR